MTFFKKINFVGVGVQILIAQSAASRMTHWTREPFKTCGDIQAQRITTVNEILFSALFMNILDIEIVLLRFPTDLKNSFCMQIFRFALILLFLAKK